MRVATLDDAWAMSEVKKSAIYVSALGYYTSEQLRAWAEPVHSDGMVPIIRSTRAFVGIVDGKIVGFANLVESSSELDQLYVDPDYGGRGVARALITVIEAEASNLGLTELRTHASWRAEPVFARLGFSRVDVEEHDFNGQSFATVHMRKAPSVAEAG